MKKFTFIVSVLLVVSLFVGCNQTPATGNDVDTSASSTTTTTTVQNGPTTIPVSELLTLKEAKEIALQTVGVKDKEIKDLEIDLDYETREKRWDYEVDFFVDNVEYNIEIDAKSGNVIHFKKDHHDAPTVSKVTTKKTEATTTAPSTAPTTSEAQTTTTSAPTTSETQTTTTSASTISKTENSTTTTSAEPTSSKTQAGTSAKDDRISAKEAKSIALKKAGTTEDKVSHYRYELDYDDDAKRWEYEIDFYVGKVEYDVEIDAANGKILKFEKETEDDKHKATATTKPNFIDEDLVWDYSVLCAGVAEEKIEDYEVELEYNKKTKIWEYDVTFKVGRLEYEIVIDAVAGEQISFHKELDD